MGKADDCPGSRAPAMTTTLALRRATAADLPIVLLNDDVMDPEVLIEEIRKELRNHRPR